MKRTRRSVHRPAEDGHWFVRKRFGFGATPVTWQGWLSTAACVAVIAPVTLIFTVFVWTRTKDGFGWRWGDRD